MSSANRLPILSQLGSAFFALLTTLVTSDQLADTLIELLLLFLVNGTAHLVTFIIIEQDLPQV